MIYWPPRGNIPRQKRYVDESPGVPIQDVVADVNPISAQAKERIGYPTQKPIALYERIIEASSNEGDIVLDPFCGCATTPIAAEGLGRQWVGIDIWDKAHETVLNRLASEGLAIENGGRYDGNTRLITFGDVHYETESPRRTDGGESAVLTLRTPTGRTRQRYTPPRQQHGKLLLDVGAFCQGCGRDYNFDPRVLEVDHIRPKSDGGSDAYDNLTLLCPPCNRAKLDRMTLTGLQEQNRQDGHLLSENEQNLRIGRAQRARRRRR
ncbi:MAG: DNA methyltransferase [Dehalococcoidia bacterium]|nr:DNA methyltransferase [Dehalococcoidia bacterium]